MRRFGVDLVTFAHPAFWGAPTLVEAVERHRRNPLPGWERLLASLVGCGVSAMELTFPPGDTGSAVAAYGSAAAAGDAFRAAGVDPVSVYWKGPDWYEAPGSDVVGSARAAAATAAAFGAAHLVLSLPMRAPAGRTSAVHVAPDVMSDWLELVRRIAVAAAEEGVRTAVHTESHSAMWTGDEVDVVMAETDPTTTDLCPDAAHLVLGGTDPVAVVRRHEDRVALAHWKDAVGGIAAALPIDSTIWSQHRHFMRTLGEGVVDWPAWSRALEATRAGALVLLELDAAPDPVGVVSAATRFVDSMVAAR
jgi:sugar phosphate isomerase/epimerase